MLSYVFLFIKPFSNNLFTTTDESGVLPAATVSSGMPSFTLSSFIILKISSGLFGSSFLKSKFFSLSAIGSETFIPLALCLVLTGSGSCACLPAKVPSKPSAVLLISSASISFLVLGFIPSTIGLPSSPIFNF